MIHMTTPVALQAMLAKEKSEKSQISQSIDVPHSSMTFPIIRHYCRYKNGPPRFDSLANISYDSTKFSKHYFM